MKFSIEAEDFRNAVKTASKIIPAKTTLPVLEHVLIEVTQEGIFTVTGSNQDVTIRTSCEINPLNIIEPGEILLPAKRLRDGLEFAQGLLTVTIEDESRATIKGRGRKLEMKALSGMEYFEMVEFNEDDRIGTFADGELGKAISFTKDSVSGDEYRMAMTGVYFDLDNPKQPAIVSTNSYKASRYKLSDEAYFKGDKNRSFILPEKAAELTSLLKGGTALTGAFVYSNNLGGETLGKLTYVELWDGSTKIISRIIDEKFPPYEPIVPREFTESVKFDPRELLQAIKSVGGFANATTKLIELRITPDKCTISAREEESGVYSDVEVKCDYTGEKEILGFNHSFLSDTIAALKGCELITMALNGRTKPVVFFDYELTISDTLRLMMPFRLPDEIINGYMEDKPVEEVA